MMRPRRVSHVQPHVHVRPMGQARQQPAPPPGQWAMGQYYPPPPYYQPQPGQQIDPLIEAGLNTAGNLLSQGDPGALETVDLIKAHMIAPPLFNGVLSKVVPSSGGVQHISQINGLLKMALWFRQNSWLALAGLIAIPVGIFALGRASGKAAVSSRGGI